MLVGVVQLTYYLTIKLFLNNSLKLNIDKNTQKIKIYTVCVVYLFYSSCSIYFLKIHTTHIEPMVPSRR